MNDFKCDLCGIEMIRLRLVSDGTVYACRNPKCEQHGKEVVK